MTTTTTQIDPTLQPYVSYGLTEAQRLYQEGTPSYYPGQTYIGATPQTLSGMDALQTRALTGNPLVGQAQGTLSNLMGAQNPGTQMYGQLYNTSQRDPSQGFYGALGSGAFQNAAMGGTQATANGAYLGGNPFFQGAFAPAARMAQQNFFDSVGQINSGASRAGRLGSNAMGELQNRAMDTYARSLNETAGGLAYQNYSNERAAQEAAMARLGSLSQQDVANRLSGAQALTQSGQQSYANQLAAAGGMASTASSDLSRQLQALGQAPTLANADYNDINMLLQAGKMSEGYQQQALDADIAKWNYNQNLPYAQLNQYTQSIYGSPAGSITTSPTYQNPLSGALGGAMLGSAIFGGTDYDMLGTIGGGLLGYLGS